MTVAKLLLILTAAAAAVFAQNPPSAETLKKANARPVASPTPKIEPFVGASVEQMTGQCVLLETEQGLIVFETLPNKAPETVRGFLNLVATGALDTTTFSRTVKGFVIQGGNLSTSEKWGQELSARMRRSLPDEPNDVKHVRGIVSMARGEEPKSATTHFFILSVMGRTLTESLRRSVGCCAGLKWPTRSTARPRKKRNPSRRSESLRQLFRAVKSKRTMGQSASCVAVVVGLCLSACTGTFSDQPTPEAAKRFLKLRGYNFDEPSFFKAAADGDVLAVNGFISAGININAKDGNEDTALTASSIRGDAKVVEALLRGGADVNAKGRNGLTALLLALSEKHSSVADLLLAQQHLDLKAQAPDGMNALMLAVWHQQERAVQTLLTRGVDMNHQDKDGDAALHGAALYGNAKILKLLLDGGANPNVKNQLGGTALMWAASYGHEEVVRLLLSRGADPKIEDVDGVTAAGWAAKNSRNRIELMLNAAERDRQ